MKQQKYNLDIVHFYEMLGKYFLSKSMDYNERYKWFIT